MHAAVSFLHSEAFLSKSRCVFHVDVLSVVHGMMTVIMGERVENFGVARRPPDVRVGV